MPVPYGGVQKPRERPNPVLEAQLAPITRIVGGSVGTAVAVAGSETPVADSVEIIKKTEDQVLTSTTLANLTGLTFALQANTDYIAHFCVIVRVANAANGYRLAITCPSGFGVFTYTGWLPFAADGSAAEKQCYGTSSGDLMNVTTVEAADTDYTAHICVIISTGATPGNLQVQGAAGTAAVNTTFRQKSLGFLRVLE